MRLALAQINPTVGDADANAARIADLLDDARRRRADLVVFPELCISGYPPRDLLFLDGFVDAMHRAAQRLGRHHSAGLTAVLGCPLHAQPRGVTNSLLVFRDGLQLARYDKRLLPTYDVFDEDRYFVPGSAPTTFDLNGTRVGLAICEDLWKGHDAGFAQRYLDAPDPVADLARLGASLILVPSASPFVLGKGRRHRDILAHHARTHRLTVASVNQVGGNDDLVFDGHAAIFNPDGLLVAAAPGFADHLLLHDLDPAAPAVPDPLLNADDDELLFHALVLGTRDYCLKSGFRDALLGISGGIDSALSAAIAVAALGPDHLTGVILPGPYSSDHARADALDLAKRLRFRALEVPINPAVDGLRHAIDPALLSLHQPALGASLPDLAEENLQSRVRGTILMALSNRSGAILLTTGNKSELAVGYCTLYGDMNGGLALISDLAKMQVYRLARWLNLHHRRAGFDQPPIPQRSIDKAPSAELRPNQTDQDSLPPYDALDQIVVGYVERRESAHAIARRAGLDLDLVLRITRMIDAAEFKRRQAPIGLKVTSVAFGPGRRAPIVHRFRPPPPTT
ncbi:MAG: NAD+ synthase [Phycisphaerae bacterium]|nr:NAD+ synthase [Phycisphaerae bacterium]